jgi:predicted nucleic acid-binding protein
MSGLLEQRLSSLYVVDASVGIQLFLKEDYSDAVAVVFASDATLIVPDLFHIECTNILWKRMIRGQYPLQSARENIVDLLALQLPTTPTAGLMGRALELAADYRVTAYDACYLALAELHAIPLLTTDGRLRKIMDGSPIQVLTIPEYLALGV